MGAHLNLMKNKTFFGITDIFLITVYVVSLTFFYFFSRFFIFSPVFTRIFDTNRLVSKTQNACGKHKKNTRKR